jgi:hypothetical protein
VKASSWLVACGLVLFSSILMSASDDPGARHAPQCDGEPCAAVVRGFLAFFDRRLEGRDGNGRACADCHMASDHFQLSPASVEARFQRLQFRRLRHPDANDPLFRPIDADDFRTNGDNANDFSILRQNGLVRITFPLPPNIRLIDPKTNAPSAETFVDVWRAVPTVNDVALTGPDGENPWARGRTSLAATSWTRVSARCRSRRSGPSPIIGSERWPTRSEKVRCRCPIPIRG